jgi:hypothetical protein
MFKYTVQTFNTVEDIYIDFVSNGLKLRNRRILE